MKPISAAKPTKVRQASPPSVGNPNTTFNELPGVIAEAPAQNATTQRGQELHTYTQSSRGPWLFPPIGKYLDQQARG